MAQLGNLIVTGSSRFLNKVYFSDEGVFSGDLNLASGNLILAGKTAIRGGVDTWLRINDTNAFSNGIYCGSNTLRTDGEFQVGSTGNYFKANSLAITCGKALNANAGLNVSGVTTLNNGVVVKNVGVELYHTTPFIDFHYNNSTADYTSRIIESSSGQININGVNFSNSTISATSVTSTNHTATNSTINTLTVSSRLAADAANAVFNNVYVKDELRSTTWAIDNITNLGSTFYVAPCIIFTNPSVYINSKSGTTVTLTITDNAIISSTIGGQTWTSGSKVKLMGRINTSILGVVNGTMARQLNTTTTKTAYITLNFATTNDCAGIEQGKTYSGSAIGDLKMMMYEVNLNVNGTTKNRPVGIRMSSYNEDKKSSIDIYNGTVDDGRPVARMGALDGLPAVNGTNPTGYGFYAAGNAYFNGTLVSSSGKIGGFTISQYTLVNNNGSNTVGMCSTDGRGWAFWAGAENGGSAPFHVGHAGQLYATNANITGVINANSGKIGSFTLDNKYMQSTDETVGLSPTDVNWAFWAGGTSMSTAKFRVNHAGVLYATSANISGNITATSGVIGGCSIYNGTLIVPSANISGTLNASQIRIGDFTEYHDLTSETYSRYGFSIVADGNNNPWFVHTPQRDIQISPGSYDYNSYKCNGGGTYHIEFEVSSTVQASTTDDHGNNTYVNINIGLYGKNTANASCWYIPFGCRSNSTGSVQKVSTYVKLDDDVRSFSTYIQCAGSGTFSGTLKIRNISIRRMADNALIVNGAITAAKISAGAITSDKINVSQLSAISADLGSITGGSINIGNGKFKVDSSGNFTATNGSLTGTVNATTMRAKQKYSIYDSSFNVYQDVIQWFGSSLSIGLTGGDDNGTLTVAGAYFDFLDNNIDCNGNLNIVNDGNLFVAKTTTTGSLSVSNTSTFNGATTFNSTLTCKSTSTFTGSLKAGSFTFRDYSEIDDNNIIYRRPVASAGSNKSRVAILQGTSNNKIVIKAQYNSTNFTNVTFTGSSSDVRLKKDIKDSSVNALSKIMQMQIREFNWKQTGVHQELGCVADELELIDPLLTTGGGYDEDGTMNIKSIDTLLLSEYAIKGIQELYRQNKQQQKRIEYLESQLKNK